MNLELIIDQKPFEKTIAIQHSIDMARKYKRIVCVVESKEKDKQDCGDLIGINYYRSNMNDFKLVYIAMPYDRISRTT